MADWWDTSGNVLVKERGEEMKQNKIGEIYRDQLGRMPSKAEWDYWDDNWGASHLFGNKLSTWATENPDLVAEYGVQFENERKQRVDDRNTRNKAMGAAWKQQRQGGAGGSGGSSGSFVDQYMNPYIERVLQGTIRDIGEQGDIRRNALGAEAFMSGAYGDARHGVEGAQLSEDIMKTIGDASNQVRAQSYESAMGWLDRDMNRQMQLGLSNASLDGAQADRMLAGANYGANMLSNNAATSSNFLDMLMNLDNYDRNWTQQDLNADFEDFMSEAGWDRDQFEGFVNFLNSVPGQQGSVTTSPNNTNWETFGSAVGGIDWDDVFSDMGLT